MGGDGLDDEGALEEDGFAFAGGEVSEGCVAGISAEELLEGIAKERVIKGEELEVFPGEGGDTIKGG